MDPDPDVGLRDTRNGIHDPHSHPRQLSRLDDHDPSSASVSYSTTNHDSPASSASTTATNTNAQVLAHHAAATLEPDDFYKTYRDSSPNSSEPESLPMTTSSSLPQPTLRPNGEGAAARHLQLPATRNLPRQNLRSASSPLDSRSAATSLRSSKPSQPSVKDLKKRFDQNSSANSTQRTPPLRHDVPTRLRQDPSKLKPQTSPTAYTNLRVASISSRETQTSSSSPLGRSQRPKYVAQDQVSNSSQSFASRVAKPRTAANRNSINSKSMTHLSRKSPPEPSLPQPPSPKLTSRSPGLLFGEILPEQDETPIAGFGIEDIRPRRTSDSSVHGLLAHQRSFTDPDAEPASPSTWYRSAQASQEAVSKVHGRSQSDISTSKSSTPIVRKPAPRISLSSSTTLPTPPSRLPVSVRRLNSPTNSSPSSTRSNSPSAHKRTQVSGKTSSKTSPTASGTKTPTGRKGPPPSLITPINNNRLQAYIAERPPKLSPPLRSSRPRQPVSVASTASSRMKETRRARSPTRLNAKDSSSKFTDAARRRKLSVGPIDFEQRREHIRLAYTKSIRESQVFEDRLKAAAEKRRKDMEAVAEAEAASKAGLETSTANSDSGDSTSGEHDTSANTQGSMEEPITESALEDLTESSSGGENIPNTSLTISTDVASQKAAELSVGEDDSPTLGMPGSFPSLLPPIDTVDRPLSIISAVTEFDMEPQTEAPVPAQPPTSISITFTQPSNSHIPPPIQTRSEYHYAYEEEILSPRQLPAAHITSPLTSPPATTQNFSSSSIVPGTHPDTINGSQDFATTYETIVTILPPSQDEHHTSRVPDVSIPFPRLDVHDDSDCQSEIDGLHAARQNGHADNDDNATDACTEDMDDRDIEERQSSYPYGDQQSSHRPSTCESSEIETFDDLLYPSYDQPSSFDPSSRLMVPSSGLRNDRLSRQSAWTDFSIESTDHSDASNSPTMQIGQSAFSQLNNLDSTEISTHDSSSMSIPYDSMVRPSTESARSSANVNPKRLPELDTGKGFSVPYLSPSASKSTSYLPSPSHEPPPVPISGPGSALNSRTSSVFYEQSQYGSTLLNSERESGEFMSHLETPQSMDITSIETSDQYFESKTFVDSDSKSVNQESEELDSKERHRLVQRRNVIKELVDTEAVFVRDMNIVEEIYKGTAEACPKLDSKTVKLIFRNSDDIIEFHTSFLTQLKDAVADVYIPKGPRSHMSREESIYSETSQTSSNDLSDARDRTTSLGPIFQTNMEKMKLAHEGFLRNSDQAAKRLIQIQQDSTVNVWLNECNEVAKDLTAAWDLDSLLIKPMQRITKYPNLIMTLLQHTPQDHPDREALVTAKDALEEAIIEINKTKKNFELVGQIVGRKRKESDVKAGLARAFGKRVDKLQGGNRPPEDPEYAKLEERFSDDYLRLQVVLRDVEFYTRQVSAYVHEFLQYLSAIELVMRLQPGSYPELESKWVQFNISIRDLEKVALEQHLQQVRKHVIEPFEHVIKAYGNPSLAMKKRQKRRMVWERSEQLKRAGKSIDPKLKELVEQYEALNDTLLKELPKLSALTEKVGHICLGNLINIQTDWYGIWKEKMKTVLNDAPEIPEIEEIVSTFQRDFPYANEHLANIGIINPSYWGRASQSTASGDDGFLKAMPRPSEDSRGRGLSVNGETAPVLPPPDFGKRHSGSFALSPTAVPGGNGGAVAGSAPSPHQYYYKDYYTTYQPSLASPRSVEVSGSSRSFMGTGQASTRPSTGRSFDSGAMPRRSTESAPLARRDSSATFNSVHQPQESSRFSNLFHSALPLPDGPEESQLSSRASSRERSHGADGYNILWLAASLFEFNIATTKHEAGYPYLTYQAGEIFDVIAEKGELWLAKNQDDPTDQVGWIWSKHFAKLADS
ncbi:Dynamin-binding-like protein [Cladobotryum mycophilum]|uniref:Dynamin-binding-like protein n=1 Tax=Cladobotryum mycophilum TaxID=491253 RepID=A0ABR0SFG8_9HYPO